MTETRDAAYLTVEEVARRYRTTPSSVHKWLHKGTAPPSLRIGKRRLFPAEALVAWEKEQMGEGGEAAGRQAS